MMSYSTWCTNGYGACVDTLDFTLENLENLISRAPEFESELKTYFAESGIVNPDIDDYLDYDEDYHSGIAFILQRVIKEAENIELCYVNNFDSDWYLLLEPSYPWYKISDEEKRLTEKTVKEIMKKYIAILSAQELDFDYQSVENGG